jgi:hypothetical protein
MSEVDLFLDQDNELRFQVAIEGSRPGSPKYRLNFETKDISYSFNGHSDTAGEIIFNVPIMKNILKEGVYKSSLEVLIDDRYFAPLTFDAKFKQEMKVTAESVSRSGNKSLGVSAAIVTKKDAPAPVIKEIAEKSIPKPVSSTPAQSLKPVVQAPIQKHSAKPQIPKKLTEAKAEDSKRVDEMTKILRDLIKRQM